MVTFVIYDTSDDRVRLKFAEACKDAGLVRFQYSAFRGEIDREERETLGLRLAKILGDEEGRFLVQPVCEHDIDGALIVETCERIAYGE